MPLSTFNPDNVRAMIGDAYLFDYPAANPGTDLTPANVLKGFLALAFADGQKMTGLAAGILPWAMQKAEGLKLDWKYKSVMVDTNLPVPPINACQYPEGMSGELVIVDPSADKIAEVLSVLSGSQVAIAPAVGQSGKTQLLLGPQITAKRYVLIYRMPSKKYPGENDVYLIPRCTFSSEATAEWTKTKNWEIKVKVMAEGDKYLMDPVTGFPVAASYIETTAPAA